MNDPNKKIDVNLSSLMSLKAELLRKQAEVSKVKATRSIEPIVPSKSKTYYKKDTITEVTDDKNNASKTYEIEDTALLEKSKKVLEAKSKFYDRMSAMGGQLNSDDNCLVLFNRKKQEDPRTAERRPSTSSDSSDCEDGYRDDGPVHPDEEWVEYTDCLGRTRKCMRGDLETIKKKDEELAASIPERLDQNQPNWMIDVVGSKRQHDTETEPPASILGDSVSVMSKHDEMRNNWEKKEIENVTKENVHYQDVFFDEARQHGVGYYAFSTDEEERARQQKELEETRRKTLNEQANKEAQRKQREKIIAERVKAAKNRQRARLGLPPLEDDDDKDVDKEKSSKETKEERKQRKKEEKLKRRQEEEERIREEERQKHIRPWDEAKTNKPSDKSHFDEPPADQPWAYKPERTPMSQEEWNERKRTERNPEFAPTTEVPRRNYYKNLEMPSANLSRTNFKADNTIFSMPPPPVPQNPFATTTVGSESFAPFQSTKRTNTFRKRNYNAVLADENNDTGGETVHRGAAIPPPKDLDTPEPYFKTQKTIDSLESSVEAGLRFLRNKFDKDTLLNKSSWTAKSDY